MQRIGVGPFELVLHDLTLAFSEAKEDRDFHKSQDQCLQDREWCAILDDKPEPHLRRVAVHSDGGICIIAELSAHIKIAGGTTKFIELIDAHDVRGTCPGRGNAGTFVVNYRCATLTFHVSREDARSPMEVVQVDAEVLSPQFGLNQTKDLGYKTKRAGQSYNCQPEQEITLGYSEAAGGIVSLALSQMVVEAFRLEMAPAPYQPKYFCRADSRVCLPVHAKPMPYIRRAKLENRRGPDEGKICIIAELSAYLQIGDDRYIELDIDAFGAMDSSQCPQELGIANAATLSFSTPCGDFTLLINREDERSPMQIAGVFFEGTESRLRLPPTVKRLDGFGAKSADHAYRCESERRVVLRQASEGAESVSLVVSNMSIEAFRTGDSADYYQPQDSCQQDNLNKLCRPDLVKSEPILSTAQAQRAGNGTGICARATLKAYFRIGRDKYVGLKDAAGGGRCQEANTGAVVTFTSDCGSLSLYLRRRDDSSPLQVSALVAQVHALGLDFFKEIDGWAADQANHAYQCTSEQTLVLREGSASVESVSLVVSDVTIEAFEDGADMDLYQHKDMCAADLRPSLCAPSTTKPLATANEARLRSSDGKGVCLIAQLEAYLKIGDKYVRLNDGKGEGSCSAPDGKTGTYASLRLDSICGALTFSLYRDDQLSPFRITSIAVRLYQTEFSGMKLMQDELAAHEAGHSYHCESEQTIVISDGPQNMPISLVLSNVTIEAFRDENRPELYQERDICALDAGGSSLTTALIWLSVVVVVGSGLYYYVRKRISGDSTRAITSVRSGANNL